MKIQHIKYLLLATATFFGSCKDPMIANPEINSPEGMVALSIDAHTSLSADVTTRATDTDITGECVTLVFDKTDLATAKLKQVPLSATVAAGKVNAMVYEEKTASYICLLVNITAATKNRILATPIGTPLSEIARQLTTNQVTSDGLSAPFIMSGWSASIAQMLRATPPTGITIPLKRIVAQIDVNSTTSNFLIHSVQLNNGAKRGYMIPQQILPYFGGNDVVRYDAVTLATPAMTLTKAIYTYENRCSQGSSTDPVRVVIFGTRNPTIAPSYYGIDLFYPDPNNAKQLAYHIERNKNYTIRLNKVEAEGYATYEDAANATAFNKFIEADIIVTDPYAFDLTTNGQQYLGVTNSEFVAYPATAGTALHDVLAATISYTCAPDWGLGKITAPTGIDLLEGVDRLEVQSGANPISRDIIIKNISPTFQSGKIVVEIGNLIKEINVRINRPTLPIGQVMNDYFILPNQDTSYKYGEIINPNAASQWLKVSAIQQYEGSSTLSDKLTNLKGGIFINAQPFLATASAIKTREASLYITGSKSDQRIRVLVQQQSADLNFKQVTPYTYVSTFHRWNQTAERVIKMNVDPTTTWWQASVYSGGEFIVLNSSASTDPQIGTDNPTYATDDAIEASCQVSGISRTVRGTSSNVMFRVGLTSKLASETSAPRYGLILLSYGTAGGVTVGTHQIMVRQGEAADYVMRPSDAATSPDYSSISRPKAVRIAPYNLTNVLGGGSGVVDHSTRGYNFTKYPSQGGYYFLSSGTKAISPTIAGTAAGLNPPPFNTTNLWNASWESCPKGYRRPHDGGSRIFTAAPTANDIKDSEIRQSLWQNPVNGAQRYDFTNSLVGYVADGFFDRRAIKAAATTSPNLPLSVVAGGTTEAAYAGVAIYNPTTFASIFIPYSGVYENGVKAQGVSGAMQLKTAGATNDLGWMVHYGHQASAFELAFGIDSRAGAEYGYSIRCVKDENPTSGTDDSQVEIPGGGGTQKLVSMIYDAAKPGTLEEQFKAIYSEADHKLISDLALHATKELTAADYAFLNSWADMTDHSLQHLILRGPKTLIIPANALTSNRWRSVLLADAHTISSGAITTSSILALYLGYLDPDGKATLTMQAGAMPTSLPNMNLNLRKGEYEIKASQILWRGYTVKFIYQY